MKTQTVVKPAHTPTPWSLNDPIKTEIVSGYGSTDISVAQKVRVEDAAYIVRAVNSHEELLGMVKELLSELSWTCENNPQYGIKGTVEKAKQAIARAESQ